jgi:hypothetical protein
VDYRAIGTRCFSSSNQFEDDLHPLRGRLSFLKQFFAADTNEMLTVGHDVKRPRATDACRRDIEASRYQRGIADIEATLGRE